jgi:hypothetical protein
MKAASFPVFSFGCFSVLLSTFPFALTVAQPPTHAPAATQPRTSDIPLTRRPRYIFEANRMYVLDETGFDWPGSDEVVARFQSGYNTMFTGVYGDMDTGDTKLFRSGQQCITPAIDSDASLNTTWACDQKGVAGPVTLTLTLYEYDGALRGLLTNPTQFCISGSDIHNARCDVPLESTAIGRYRVSYTEADLAGKMLHPGQSKYEWFLLDNCSETVTVHNGACAYATWLPSYAAYRLMIKITRMPDEIVTPPVMQ